MEEQILKDYGWCKIIQRYSEYFICYDGGGVVVKMLEMEVGKEQAAKAMLSQHEAENVIREVLKR